MKGGVQVSVDRDFARFGSKSYAINKINSVDVRSRRPHGEVAAILTGIIAGLFAILAVVSIPIGAGIAILFLIISVGLAAMTRSAWRRSKIVEYRLFLTTSSQEAQAFVSNDRQTVIALREQIERAMAGRVGDPSI